MSNYAIYKPKGKAGEYAEWACNFYVGCSNDCEYCYCKKGLLAHVMGGKIPTLKKCFKDEVDALQVFEKELKANLTELQRHGLFFSFTTDPMIVETKRLTISAVKLCNINKVPVKVLTKEAGYVYLLGVSSEFEIDKSLIAVGFTLTGHNELEPGASTNAQRIKSMELCKQAGYKTFASIEPIIDFKSSMNVVEQSISFCDHYKIGLMSGQKVDKAFKAELTSFVGRVCILARRYRTTIYWKESIVKVFGGSIYSEQSVSRDFNLFE